MYEKVFGDLPLGIPPYKGVEHAIKLEIGTQPIKMHPYRHPKIFRDDIAKAIKELLDLGLIRPSSNPYAFSVVKVKKNDGTLRMCIDFRALNKKTVKNIYHIPSIHELMDEIHGVKCYIFINYTV